MVQEEYPVQYDFHGDLGESFIKEVLKEQEEQVSVITLDVEYVKT